MYTRITRSGPRSYLQLVQGYRDAGGKVKQRVVASLGRVDKLKVDDLTALIEGLQRAVGLAPDPGGELQFESARALGEVWALDQLWQQLGLDRAGQQALRGHRRRFDVEAALRVLVLNRLIDPQSKLGVLRWLETVALAPTLSEGWNPDRLLRAMDTLMDRREALERAVAGQIGTLLERDLSVVFYDLTTIRISGVGKVSKDVRQYGYSKDSGAIARQFVLGVVQSAEGLPLSFEVFEGNISEGTTLLAMLRRCVERYRIERVVIVADRGLLSLDNMAALEALELPGVTIEYILAVPARRYAEFSAILAEQHPLLVSASERDRDAQAIRETTWQARRLVIAHDASRAAEQTQARRDRINELDQYGEQLAQRLDRQEAGKAGRGRRATDRSVYTRFTQAVAQAHLSRIIQPDLQAERFCYDIDHQALAEAERVDGKLLLVSNVQKSLSAEQILSQYKALADIERGFRVLKSDIEIAPVYHRLPQRIRAHALICFLALVLHRVLRQRLQAAQADYSPQRALQCLRQIQHHRVKLHGRIYQGISQLTGEQKRLFEKLKLPTPTLA